MRVCKKILSIAAVLCLCGFAFNAFAVDQAAKEETSPANSDGPLTAEQIPPINSTIPPNTAAGSQSNTPPAGSTTPVGATDGRPNGT